MKQLKTFLQPDGTYRYVINAPDWVVDREERPHYEKDRFASMEANLKYGDVLFDVGAELGWQSVIYAKFVGPEHVVLIERVPEFWPTIREIWEENFKQRPYACFCGFASDRTTEYVLDPSANGWAVALLGKPMVDFSRWRDALTSVQGNEITLDDLSSSTTPVNAITIDVEGAELKVLAGAEKILARSRPLIWVSVHPRQRLEAFGAQKDQIFRLMHTHSYNWQYLGVDHEEHWFFYPTERADEVVLVESPGGTYGKRNLSFEQAMPNWMDDMGMPYTSEWAKR